MTTLSDEYYQTANRQYIEKEYGRTKWIQIAGKKDLNGAAASFWCVLIKKENVDVVFRDASWDNVKGKGGPGFEAFGDTCTYRSNLLDNGFEPLLFFREFYGVKNDYTELAQEFVLLNNLYFDEKTKIYYAMLEDGTSPEVVRIENEDNFLINLSYLLRYATAKQMAVILYFNFRSTFEESVEDLGLKEYSEEYKNDDLYYQVWGGNTGVLNNKAFSILCGKKIIYPREIETCGYWPYEKEEEYVDYIIGIDEFGNEKTYTCDPNKLSYVPGGNPNIPHYFTPVFFTRDVLQKYISQPELYTVSDGTLECKRLWSLEIDNHHKNVISVYLGDLGQRLPESERLYWKSFNIFSDEGISTVSFQRDFLNICAESDMSEHRFKQHYIETNDVWNQKYGWPLFLPLSSDDQYNFDLLRIPLMESQHEFDVLVLSLVKVLIDSLNEAMIQETIEKKANQKGIGKLESWLKTAGHIGFEKHIKFLRDLQDLRSQGTGHRKGSDYDNIASSFGLGRKSFQDVYDDILTKADDFLLYMKEIAKPLST